MTPQKIAQEFRAGMQAIIDKSNGDNTSISIGAHGGEHFIPIATKKEHPMNKQETLNIKCPLTDEEMMEITKDMCEHINKKKQAEDNLASYSAQMKAEVKGHDATINRSAMLINAGSEYRNILCDVDVNPDTDTVTWVRPDTGKVVSQEKPIPNRFLQTKIDLF